MASFESYKKHIISFFIFWSIFLSCSGSYYGVNGNATYNREESIDIITTAQFLWLTNCVGSKSGEQLILEVALTTPRLILDSAYYSKKDIKECEKAILITPCSEPAHSCQLGPEEFFNGRLLQGGI
ncbi:MAG: hypothetical protein JJT78_11570 [Leptospira sp.]|nr:hypothetical protein [Leptospira sp.]